MKTQPPYVGSSSAVASEQESGAFRRTGEQLFLLVLYVLFLVAYVRLRFDWNTLEGDAIKLTALSQNVLTEGTLVPAGGSYPYGYAYPVLNTFLAHFTGMPLAVIQVYLQPFLVALLVPVSFIAYRSLTGRGRVALLAGLLLFLSPEFLYEATRSSHAKVTLLLALTMLFILARSLRPGRPSSWLAAWVAAFYLAAFAMITSSSFFASSYLFGIAFAFAATLSLLYLRRSSIAMPAQMRRLAYVTISAWLLVFLFMFYVYPPSRLVFQTLDSTLEKVTVFFLNVELESGANPYAYIQSTWLSPWIYVTLTSLNWIVLLLSLAAWLRQGWSLWVRREDMPGHRLLLWLLCASFGLLMVLAVLVDRAGALSANLQLRIFPHFLLVGIPLASEALVALVGRAQRNRRTLPAQAVPVLFVALLSFLSLASLLKITNEPLLSSWWSFYQEQERLSVQWITRHVRNNQVWAGRDIRVRLLAEAYGDWQQQGIQIDREGPPISARYVLQSDISQMRADRLAETLPDTRQFSKVYDAGDTELYYSRALTPYQR